MKTKTLLLSLTMLLVVTASYAQPSAGTIMAGGQFNLTTGTSKFKTNSTTITNQSTTNFTIQPMAGLFIADNIAIGGGIGYTLYSEKRPVGDNDLINTSSMITISPFARYYLTSGRVGVFAEAAASLGFGGSKVKMGSNSQDGPRDSLFGLGAAPGLYYYLTDNVSLDASFGFLGFVRSSSKDDDGDREIDQVFGLNFNTTTLNFGILFHF